MNIKQNIDFKEKELVEYISGEISKNVEMLINWEYSSAVIEHVLDKEQSKAEIICKEMIEPILKKELPFSWQIHTRWPLEMFFYGSWYFSKSERWGLVKNNEKSIKNLLYYRYIYKDLEKLGFPTSLSKRVISEYEKNGTFLKVRILGGMGLIFPDMQPFIKKSRRLDQNVKYGPNGFEYYKEFDWIFSTIEENTKEKIFEQSKIYLENMLLMDEEE